MKCSRENAGFSRADPGRQRNPQASETHSREKMDFKNKSKDTLSREKL